MDPLSTLFPVYAAVLGLAVGSFLSVCVARLPLGESVISPRSHCPLCGTDLEWRDNIPVLSWILLRGRCRYCHERIPLRYPLVELATGGIWLGMAILYGPTWLALTGAVFLSLLLTMALIDARHQIIPDLLSLGGVGAGLALSLFPGGVGPVQAVLGAGVGYGALWVVGWAGDRLFRTPAMGGGDMKMMGMVGAFLGAGDALLTIFLGAVAGALVFGPVALARRERQLRLPFGVFLAVGAAAAFLAGEPLTEWYLALLG